MNRKNPNELGGSYKITIDLSENMQKIFKLYEESDDLRINTPPTFELEDDKNEKSIIRVFEIQPTGFFNKLAQNIGLTNKKASINLNISVHELEDIYYHDSEKVYSVTGMNNLIGQLTEYRDQQNEKVLQVFRNIFSKENILNDGLHITNEREFFTMLVIRRLNNYYRTGDTRYLVALKDFAQRAAQLFPSNQNNKSTHVKMSTICSDIVKICHRQIKLVEEREAEQMFSKAFRKHEPKEVVNQLILFLFDMISEEKVPANILNHISPEKTANLTYLQKCSTIEQYKKNTQNQKLEGGILSQQYLNFFSNNSLFSLVKKVITNKNIIQQYVEDFSKKENILNPINNSTELEKNPSIESIEQNEFNQILLTSIDNEKNIPLSMNMKKLLADFCNLILNLIAYTQLYANVKESNIEGSMIIKLALYNNGNFSKANMSYLGILTRLSVMISNLEDEYIELGGNKPINFSHMKSSIQKSITQVKIVEESLKIENMQMYLEKFKQQFSVIFNYMDSISNLCTPVIRDDHNKLEDINDHQITPTMNRSSINSNQGIVGNLGLFNEKSPITPRKIEVLEETSSLEIKKEKIEDTKTEELNTASPVSTTESENTNKQEDTNNNLQKTVPGSCNIF